MIIFSISIIIFKVIFFSQWISKSFKTKALLSFSILGHKFHICLSVYGFHKLLKV